MLCTIHYLTLVLIELLILWLFPWTWYQSISGLHRHPPPPPPPQYVRRYQFIHLGVVKHYDSEVSCTRTQHSHLSEACTRTFSIRCQNTNHWVTTPPIYYLNKCTLENLRICISKPWLLKCQSIMTEKMFRIVSVLNESIEMMLKCLRNRGVISFLPPPGGPMADTSNWSTSFRIDVSFLEAKRAIRYKAIAFGYDGATRRGTGSSWRGVKGPYSQGVLGTLKTKGFLGSTNVLMHLHHLTICVDPCLPRLLNWRTWIF